MSLAVKCALANAALALAAESGWSGVSLHRLAAEAKRPVQDFYPHGVADVGEALDTLFDIAAAGEEPPNLEDPERERLFEAAMRRFEAMEPHRAAILAIEAADRSDPVAQAAALARASRSARWLFAVAGLDGDGVLGAARVQGFALVLGRAKAAWRLDDAGDFAKTMAALDKGLRDAEAFEDRWGLKRREK
jgi:hypothetical protein